MVDPSVNGAGVNGHRSWPYKVISSGDKSALDTDAVLAHLKIDLPSSAETERVNSLIKAATSAAERYTRRLLVVREFETYRDSFPASAFGIELRKSPFYELTSFEKMNSEGAYEAVSTDIFQEIYDNAYSWLGLKKNQSWGDAYCERNFLKIVFKAGVGETPEEIADSDFEWVPIMLHGILMHITYLNENKGDCSGKCSAGSASLPDSIANIYESIRLCSIAIHNTN